MRRGGIELQPSHISTGSPTVRNYPAYTYLMRAVWHYFEQRRQQQTGFQLTGSRQCSLGSPGLNFSVRRNHNQTRGKIRRYPPIEIKMNCGSTLRSNSD